MTPGQTLFVNVGGNGTAGGTDANGTPPAGGFNGGGSGGSGSFVYAAGDSGGGATDVRSFSRVTFTVERPKAGIRRGGRCVKRTRTAPANAKKCTRWVKVKGSFAQNAKAGANSIRFMGRLRGRALRRGSYRLVVKAKDAAGNRTAKPARRGFRIV